MALTIRPRRVTLNCEYGGEEPCILPVEWEIEFISLSGQSMLNSLVCDDHMGKGVRETARIAQFYGWGFK